MGHERLGALPRSKRWQEVVNYLSEYSETSDAEVKKIASKTIENVRLRIPNLKYDQGIKAAFEFLVQLSLQPRKESLKDESIKIDLPENPTPLKLTQTAKKWIEQNTESEEYSNLAFDALTDTIVEWNKKHRNSQSTLFENDYNNYEVWKEAGKGRGFSELSRSFFSNFIEDYLNYFLEREASHKINSLERRELFSDQISRHSYETSKITQSLAAGWFNKHAKNTLPDDEKVSNFLEYAFSKINEELLREE